MLARPEIDLAHARIGGDFLRRALREHGAADQHDDVGGEAEHDVHVVLDEQQGQIVGLQRVLVIGIALPRPDAEVLGRGQEERRAWDPGQALPQPGDDVRRRDLALAERFELHEDGAGIGLPAAGEADHVCNGRIGLHDVDEARQLLAHELEGDAVIGPDAPTLDPQLCEPLLIDEGTGLEQPAIVFYAANHAEHGYDEFRRRFKDRLTLREAPSRERLLEQTTFFLHRDLDSLSPKARHELESMRESQPALADRKVLIVDDDMRNIFALATVLDEQGMIVISADNGREAIQHVQQDPSIDVVLMDIMMPEMDGIATIQEIRKIPERHELPIIAVTAKAMKGDREKCIAAGAWDYLSKPVNTQVLLAALRAWLKA